MFFPDYTDMLWILTGALLLLFGIWLLWAKRKGMSILLLLIRVLGCGVVGLGGIWVVLALSWSLKSNRSAPVFSPDHSKALRVIEQTAFSPRGLVVVELYSNHGLFVSRIFDSGLNEVDDVQVRWKSSSEVSISVSGEGGYSRAKRSAGGVKISWE